MHQRVLHSRHGSYYLNIPASIVKQIAAKEGDIFEIYNGGEGVIVIGRSPENDTENLSQNTRDVDNRTTDR